MATNEAQLEQNHKITIIPSGIKRHQIDLNCEDSACEEVINLRYKSGSWRTVGDKTAYLSFPTGSHEKLYYHQAPNINAGDDFYIITLSTAGHIVMVYKFTHSVYQSA